MTLLGRGVLLLAFAAALYAVGAALWSRRPGRRRFLPSAERAVWAVGIATTTAAVAMWVALLTDRFDIANVAGYSDRTLGWRYKLTALWGSQAGSLLLWAWLISLVAVLVVVTNRRRNRQLMPVVIAVLMGTSAFFTSVLSFVTSPFATVSPVPVNGRGLNPLLQNVYMESHPPLLYIGYVGLSVPFAFAIAALVTRRLDSTWITSVRRWTVVSWLFLTLGIILGSRWAYEELGWGGYWAWDPVENAALMPWLVATAFLHSVMVQERRGMLRIWNMVLIILTFTLALFGTFLTRSGILSSVHAFGESTLGPYFLAFIVAILVGSFALLVTRLPLLRSENSLESYISREAIFLYNNLLLVGLAFAVFWGTIFPVLSEVVRGDRITVGQGFFNQVAAPVGLALLFFTGVGPLIPWRTVSPAELRRRFGPPLVVAIIAVIPAVGVAQDGSHWWAAAAIVLAAFTVACIIGEYWRGVAVRRQLGDVSWPATLGQLFVRNRRRYGGYVVHLGVVSLIVAIACQGAFSSQGDLALRLGASGEVSGYTFTNEGGTRTQGDHTMSVGVTLAVSEGGARVATLVPRVDMFTAQMQRSTEVAIDSSPLRDVYVVLVGLTPDGLARISVFVNPMMMWIWVGGLIMLAGSLVAVWPPRRPRDAVIPAPARADDGVRE
ncbi:MAG: heme lyase CcmF/NrfE family subunit [Thermoleophilia bacterium]|nr:heme lyase CcmF/NrfE family subunit [Thermoleophilia bacterium]